MAMSGNIHERYGPYAKKKEKKRVRPKEGRFLKRSYEWLKWKVEKIGEFNIHHPCLEH
jgi:hypothetical protein